MSTRIPAPELEDHVGSYFTPFIDGEKVAAEIVKVMPDDKLVRYKIVSGAKKGETWQGEYQELSNISIYDQDELVLALLQTGEKKR
jgi:ribosomal protein L21